MDDRTRNVAGAIIIIAVIVAAAAVILTWNGTEDPADEPGGDEGSNEVTYILDTMTRTDLETGEETWYLLCELHGSVDEGMSVAFVCDGYDLGTSEVFRNVTTLEMSTVLLLEETYGMSLDHIFENVEVVIDGYTTVRTA